MTKAHCLLCGFVINKATRNEKQDLYVKSFVRFLVLSSNNYNNNKIGKAGTFKKKFFFWIDYDYV